jgi:hypothetical protein
MNNIQINNIIQEDKVSINFNLQDGSLSFPTLDLLTSGDIELNPLIIKLTELLELHRKIEITYEDALSLLEVLSSEYLRYSIGLSNKSKIPFMCV